jgi:DNA topoisomerase-1
MSGLVSDAIGAADPVVAAEEAGLSYVRDHENGIRRVKTRSGFRYIDPKGKPVSDEATLKRIRSLVIPPAWTNVWICASPTGHIQAVGRDARGRKQYRYHTAYRYQRDQTKYERMLEFGKALPQIRQRVAEDLQAPGLTKRKVMATVISILERTCMRVGNEEYRESNKSYGLTTLQDKHVKIEKSVMRFRFRGKSGQDQDIQLEDPQLARIVKKCRDIPGYELFQYLDEDGTIRDVTSSDVNEYIREVTGQSFTAKDFRTWGGTGWATVILSQLGASETENDAKKAVVEAIKEVSKKLGNRPATCKKYYVHPAILDAYSKGELTNALQSCEGDASVETCVMRVVSSYVDKVSQEKKASSDLSHRLQQSIQRQTKKRQQETAAV